MSRLRRLSVDSAVSISTDTRRPATIVSGKEYVGRLFERKRLDRNDLLNELCHCHSGSRQWFIGQRLANQAVIVLRRDGGMVVFRSLIVWISLIVVTMLSSAAVRAEDTQHGRMSVLLNVMVME